MLFCWILSKLSKKECLLSNRHHFLGKPKRYLRISRELNHFSVHDDKTTFQRRISNRFTSRYASQFKPSDIQLILDEMQEMNVPVISSELIFPLQPRNGLDQSRIEYYKQQILSGIQLNSSRMSAT